MNTEPLLLLPERVDDVPLLWGLMQRLGLAEVLHTHLGSRHLRQGLAKATHEPAHGRAGMRFRGLA